MAINASPMTNLSVLLALFGYLPIVVVLFVFLPPRRAVLVSLIGGWLVLPIARFSISGWPDYDKMTATSGGVFLASLIFHLDHWQSFRARWFDIPMVIWCCCPLISSLHNDLGWFDGTSAMLNRSIAWLLPYLLGRIYFRELPDMRELAIAIVISGLVYVPLCLYEVRMSPQLHRLVYGWHQHSFAHTLRFGGYRPMVFMHHGLMTGMWMACSTLVGLWLSTSGSFRRWGGVSSLWWSVLLFVTAILCKSAGAVLLLLLGLSLLYASSWMRSSVLVLCCLAIPVTYVVVRSADVISMEPLVSLAESTLGAHRAQSLEFRFTNESILAERALERPVFGWGGWGRSRVVDEQGFDISTTDGLWIIALGENGIVGLATLISAMLVPCFLIVRRYSPDQWSTERVAPVAVLSMLLLLYMIDGLLNAMVNPVFHLLAGAVSNASQIPRHFALRRGTHPNELILEETAL